MATIRSLIMVFSKMGMVNTFSLTIVRIQEILVAWWVNAIDFLEKMRAMGAKEPIIRIVAMGSDGGQD